MLGKEAKMAENVIDFSEILRPYKGKWVAISEDKKRSSVLPILSRKLFRVPKASKMASRSF